MQTAHSFKSGGRILVVDDSPLILSILEDKLGRHGFDVVTADCAGAAMDLAFRRTDPFDLFIVDVRMPDIDGYEVTRSLRSDPATRNTPILLLTSVETSDDTVAGLEAGADDYLTKSVSDGELLARVRSLVSLGALRERLEGQHAVVEELFGEKDKTTERAAHPDVHRLVRILVAHGNPEVAGQLRRLVGRQPNYLVHDAPEGALAETEMKWANVVLADFGRVASVPPNKSGIIVVDDAPSVERRIQAFHAGVEDYVPVGTPLSEIAARISSIMRRQDRFRHIEQARDQAVLAAISDPLTGLYNHGYFQEYLRAEILRSERYDEPFTVIMADIDHFKRVNDTFGHPVGDRVLKEVARRLREVVRATDLLARYGGEEFAIVLPHTSPEEGRRVADKIRHAFDVEPIVAKDHAPLQVTVSLGVGYCPLDGGHAGELLDRVDAALYAAKRGGRNRVVATSDLALSSPLEPSQAPEVGEGDRALGRLEALLADEAALRSARHAERVLDALEPGHPARPAAEVWAARERDLFSELERIADELRRSRRPSE